MDKKNYFFVDAETDGLYGRILSVAAIVTDGEFNIIDSFYGAADVSEDSIESQWVKENVFQFLKNARTVYRSEEDLCEAFWQFWEANRNAAYCVADVPYPVETGLFRKCVMYNEEARSFLAPFPILDISSILFAAGIDPDVQRTEFIRTALPQHDPFNDVLISIEVFKKLFKGE